MVRKVLNLRFLTSFRGLLLCIWHVMLCHAFMGQCSSWRRLLGIHLLVVVVLLDLLLLLIVDTAWVHHLLKR